MEMKHSILFMLTVASLLQVTYTAPMFNWLKGIGGKDKGKAKGESSRYHPYSPTRSKTPSPPQSPPYSSFRKSSHEHDYSYEAFSNMMREAFPPTTDVKHWEKNTRKLMHWPTYSEHIDGYFEERPEFGEVSPKHYKEPFFEHRKKRVDSQGYRMFRDSMDTSFAQPGSIKEWAAKGPSLLPDHEKKNFVPYVRRYFQDKKAHGKGEEYKKQYFEFHQIV